MQPRYVDFDKANPLRALDALRNYLFRLNYDIMILAIGIIRQHYAGGLNEQDMHDIINILIRLNIVDLL